MLVFAVPFFPAVHEAIVRSDTYSAIGGDRAADIQTDAHPDGFTGNDEIDWGALMFPDAIGRRTMLQLIASRST